MESYAVYVLLSGEAEVIKNYFGNPVAVRALKKGDVFGANALVIQTPRLASVVAVTDLEVGLIYRNDFLKMLDTLPPDVSEMLKNLVGQLREAYEVSSELAFHTRRMIGIKQEMETANWGKLRHYVTELPGVAQTVLVSLERGMADMHHSYFKLANKLDKVIVDVDELFTQSTGLK